MKLPWKTEPADVPVPPTRTVSRRWAATRCAVCPSPQLPLIYFQNGKDYCQHCAINAQAILGIRPAGRRYTDPPIPLRLVD